MPKTRSPGDGMLRYHERDKRWIGRLQVGITDGQRRFRQVSGRTRKEAELALARLRDELAHPPDAAPAHQTVGEYLDWWLAEIVEPARTYRTARHYGQIVRLYLAPELGHLALRNLTAQPIQAMLNRLARRDTRRNTPMSPRTVAMVRDVLRNALNHAIGQDLLARNPAERVTIQAARRAEIVPYDVEQAGALLRAIRGHRLEALYTVVLAVGARPGEALGLRWDDVDFGRGLLHLRVQLQREPHGLALVDLKTARSRRTIPLPKVTLSSIHQRKVMQLEEQVLAGPRWVGNTHGLVFTSTIGTPLQARNVDRLFKRFLADADLPDRRFYDLRHTCASLLLAQGVDLRVIMEILGHSQISLTADTYSHVLESVTRDAMERMDTALGTAE